MWGAEQVGRSAHCAYFRVHSRAVSSYFLRSILKRRAISGTSGSSGFGSVSSEQTDSSTAHTTHPAHTHIHRTTGTVAQWHSQVLLWGWGWDYTRLYSHPSHTVHLSYQLKEHPIIHQLFYTLFHFYIAYMVHLRKRNDCKNKKMIKTKRIQD